MEPAPPPKGPGLLRRMLSSATAAPRDPELGGKPTSAAGTTAPNGRPLTVMTSDRDALVPPEDKLLIFRTLTGIDTVPVVSSAGHTVRTAPNIGIYTRVVRHERHAKKLFRAVKLLSSLCLGLQIIMGAAVTALGASKGSYNGITGLGAVSTVTASIVAYIKGTGQPQRLKYVEKRWKWIREHIEQRERELCLADCPLDVYREVQIIEEMYRIVTEELEAESSGQQQQQQQQNGAPVAAAGGIGGSGGGGAMSGTTVGMRRRSEIASYDGREAPHNTKSTARPESTATWECRCEGRPADSGPTEKPPKE